MRKIILSFTAAFIMLAPLTSAVTAAESSESTRTVVADEAEVIKTATVSGNVLDEAGIGIIAQVVITGEDFLERINTDFLGRFELVLPLGEYQFEITKGSEYERELIEVEVSDRRAKIINPVTLDRLYETDWIAGDIHQHSVYSFDATDAPADILLSNLAMGLQYGFLTDHNEVKGNAEFSNATLHDFIPFPGNEITTNLGHFNALNFNEVVDYDVTEGSDDLYRIFDTVHADEEAILQVNHPLRDGFTFDDWDMIQAFDLIEVWNGKAIMPYVEGDSNAETKELWYDLMNEDIYIAATAGSDNHDIGGNPWFGSDGELTDDEYYFMTTQYSGSPRTYIYPEEHNHESVLEALVSGNSFLTNNPLAFLTINGAIPGETVAPGMQSIDIQLQSNRQSKLIV